MTYLGYVLTGTAAAVLLNVNPIVGVIGASILYVNKLIKNMRFWQPNFHSQSTPGAYHQHLFSMMGYLAKADGVISSKEIAVAQKVMDELCLNFAQKTMAKSAFKEGSQGINLNNTIMFLKILNHTQPKIVSQFFSYQELVIHADTHKSMSQINILNQVKFHVYQQQQQYHQPTSRPRGNLQQAYKTLGLNASMEFSEMKRTYRKLLGKHHPDRKQDPLEKKRSEELIKQFQQAWNIVKAHHAKETT